MLKNISILLTSVILAVYALDGFAVSVGAGQAQIRNNMQEMQQNNKRIQQIDQNRMMHAPQTHTPQTHFPQTQQRLQNQAQ